MDVIAMPLKIAEDISYINQTPKKLVVFLHGYIDSAYGLRSRLDYLLDNLSDAAIHLPQAPFLCEVYEKKAQWYSMHQFDPNDDRKTVPTMAECVAFYDKMGAGLKEAHKYLCDYLHKTLALYNLQPQDLFLCGFSQGATLALYTSLMYERQIAGCVSFSGMLSPHNYLLKNFLHTPDTLLIHGTKDNLVRFECMDFTAQNLKHIGCKVQTLPIEGQNHRVDSVGLTAAVNFIDERSTKKVAI